MKRYLADFGAWVFTMSICIVLTSFLRPIIYYYTDPRTDVAIMSVIISIITAWVILRDNQTTGQIWMIAGIALYALSWMYDMNEAMHLYFISTLVWLMGLSMPLSKKIFET